MKNFKAYLKHSGSLETILLIRGKDIEDVTNYINNVGIPNNEYRSMRINNEPVILDRVEPITKQK